MNKFHGYSTHVIKNNVISLEYLTNAGPRIVRLSAFRHQNLLADIPDMMNTPYGIFSFHGGHRLWCAPEIFPETYFPDNENVSVENLPDGVRLVGGSTTVTGIRKSIEIHLNSNQPRVTLKHILRNEGAQKQVLAPWALTMFRLGGTVILPQPVGNVDQNGLLNNRILALWPYTRINDPRLVLRDDFILIHTPSGSSPLKIGYYNPHGWMAYWMDGILFRKLFPASSEAAYPDGGCNTESYCNDHFVELESLGSTVKLKSQSEIYLDEIWEVYQGLDVPFLSSEIIHHIDSL